MQAQGIGSRNEIEFRSYRKYSADTSITFDDPGDDKTVRIRSRTTSSTTAQKVRMTAQSMPRAPGFYPDTGYWATLGLSVALSFTCDSSPDDCNLCFAAHTVAFETPAVAALFWP